MFYIRVARLHLVVLLGNKLNEVNLAAVARPAEPALGEGEERAFTAY